MRLARSIGTILLALCLAASVSPLQARADGNHAPVALDDPAVPGCNPHGSLGGTFMVPEDLKPDPTMNGWLTVLGSCSPLANDTDADGDPLTMELVSGPSHGTAQIDNTPPGWLLYKFEKDFSTLPGNVQGGQWVSDTITYRDFDGQAYSNVATYKFWVAPVNDAPSFTPGPATVNGWVGEGPVSIPWATNIKAGPANEAYQAVDFEVVGYTPSGPDVFAVAPAIDSSGNLTFTPGATAGYAHVTVHLHDNGGLEDYSLGSLIDPPADTSATVQFLIQINPFNPSATPGPPTAVDDTFSFPPGLGGCLNVTNNDTSPTDVPFSVTSFTQGGHGTVVPGAGGSCELDYLDQGYLGDDSFTYTITDMNGMKATGTVHLTVLTPPPPPNVAPVAFDDNASVAEGAAASSIDVLANDTDADGDPLSISAVTTPSHGSAVINGSKVDYTPDPLFYGDDTFDYTMSDGHGHTDTATVSVTVTKDATPPTVGAISASLPSQAIGSSVKVRLAWTATDAVPGVTKTELQMSSNGGTTWTNVTLASATATSATVTLVPGTRYTFRTRATDGNDSTSAWQVRSSFAVRLAQETTSTAVYSGTWTRLVDSRESGGTSKRATAKGAKVTYSFTGRTIAWIGARGAKGGRAQIRIDGVLIATVDTYASSTSFRRTLWAKTLASGGAHKIEIRVLGDGFVDADAFVVLP